MYAQTAKLPQQEMRPDANLTLGQHSNLIESMGLAGKVITLSADGKSSTVCCLLYFFFFFANARMNKYPAGAYVQGGHAKWTGTILLCPL